VAAEDWERFLRLGAAELRPGGETVVTTLLSGPGPLDWMALIEAGAKEALETGITRAGELEAMILPTYIRKPSEFFRAVEGAGRPLTLGARTDRDRRVPRMARGPADVHARADRTLPAASRHHRRKDVRRVEGIVKRV
jgi:hypothetical protein